MEEAKSIHIGQYRMVQGSIDCFYSEEKAQIKYAHFLHDYKAVVEYEDKPKPQSKENKVETGENAKPAAEKEDGETAEMNFFFFTDPNNNYLNYNVEDLIHDL